MTAKQLRKLPNGIHQIRIKGLNKMMNKTQISSYEYHFEVGNGIFIYINPVYDTLFLMTNKEGLSFERQLNENDLTLI